LRSCWKVPCPVVGNAASAVDNSNAGGIGLPGLAEPAAARRDTAEIIEDFMTKLRNRARIKSTIVERRAGEKRFRLRGKSILIDFAKLQF
jgi:hypothetical protein